MDKWLKFQRLSSSERWLLAQALVLLPLTDLALQLIGLRRWQSALARLGRFNESSVESKEVSLVGQARLTARIVRMAARHGLYDATCLPQSLTLWWLLRRQRINSVLRIGVRKESGRIDAHAWVESMGLALNEGNDVYERFLPFESAIAPVEMKPQ